MKARQGIGLVVVLLLGLASTALAVRVARHLERGAGLRLELGRARLTRVDPATAERLARLEERVLVTYYVSARERMPSHMRDLERDVTDLLVAMRRSAPRRFDFQIVDPDRDPELARFAASRRVAPIRVRSVTRDAWDERTVWSTLAISYGARREVLVHGLEPEELPRLQATLVAWLDQLERPRAAVIALAAPPGFSELAEALAERGTLIEVALDEGEAIPDADLLVWMAPEGPARTAELDRFLERGGSVLVAGARHALGAGDLVAVEGRPALSLAAPDRMDGRTGATTLEELLAHYGLRPLPGLLLDARHETLELAGEPHEAPFVVRCIAPNQDFHAFPTQPNGTLLFAAASPLALDDAVLREGGWRAEVLATSSDESRIVADPGARPLPLDEMAGAGTAVAKQALIVALEHRDPWRGRLIACAATTPFEDGALHRERTAHPRLLATLLAGTVSEEQLVASHAPVARAAPLPAMGWRTRALWRALCVFAAPALLALTLWRRSSFRPVRPGRGLAALMPAATGAATVAIALALVRLAAAADARLDATSEGLNRLAPETAAIARRSAERGAVSVELVLSERGLLPPPLRRPVDRLHAALGELRRAGAELDVVVTRPPGESGEAAAERERLDALGVRPFRLSTQDGDVTTVRTFHATAILTRGERREVLRFPDVRAFEHLEFRLAFALWRLNEGRRPHVAFASDVPRLSAAEAYEDYQQKGLFAPSGRDVYGLARETLVQEGFRVTHVNPREPELPDDVDLLVWMQPRRSIEAMLEATVRYLVGGGRVLLAAQHFNIQARQYRGADFEVVYWPQPQTPDVEHLYFPELSIELVREVLFDRLSLPIDAETQISGRGARRDFERQVSALPFLIRASAQNFDRASLVTRDLGDQAFPWAAYLRWDPARLAELGIAAHPLITTSERTWSFAWKGGWLPPEVLAGPPAATLGRLPLAVLFEGRFPPPAGPLRLRPSDEEASTGPAIEPVPDARPGKLLFLGGSELFKDERLQDPAFRGDHLLWNAAAALALPNELARVAVRRPVARGLDYVEPERRLAWRAFALAAGPLAVLAVAGVLALGRRRRSPAGTGGPR